MYGAKAAGGSPETELFFLSVLVSMKKEDLGSKNEVNEQEKNAWIRTSAHPIFRFSPKLPKSAPSL